MPRKGRGSSRAVAGGSATSRVTLASGSAASSRIKAPYALPASLLSAFDAVPRIAAALLPASFQSAAVAGGSKPAAPGQLQGMADRLSALAAGLRATARDDLSDDDDRAAHSAVVAALLSRREHSSALLKLYAAAVRPEVRGTGGPQEAEGGAASALSAQWRRDVAEVVLALLVQSSRVLPPTHHALSVLRFARAILRSQALQALSRQASSAAADLEACTRGDGGGGATGAAAGNTVSAAAAAKAAAVAKAGGCMAACARLLRALATALCALEPWGRQLSPEAGLTEEVSKLQEDMAGLRRDCVEDLATALEGSGLLQHAARLLLLLQARAPQALWPPPAANPQADPSFSFALDFFVALESCAGYLVDLADQRRGAPVLCSMYDATGCSPAVSPAAAAALRSAFLGGPHVRTAVLVYGITSLRMVDRGPVYGMPAELQAASLALCQRPGPHSPRHWGVNLMVQLIAADTSGGGAPVALLGRRGSLGLALRVARVALGSAENSSGLPPETFVDSAHLLPPPLPKFPSIIILPAACCARLGIAALQLWRRLLPLQRAAAAPDVEEQRREWWQLAAWALFYSLRDEGLDAPALPTLLLQPLWHGARPGRPDPVEVKAAAASGLLQQMTICINLASLAGTAAFGAASASRLLYACSAAPHGCNLTALLTCLHGYGDTDMWEDIVGAVGRLQGAGAGTAPAWVAAVKRAVIAVANVNREG
ncbi:hypothetical protein HYH03_017243 [Edaphochlamys debaryana]|uniref:Uncharacterized protein n=1 Tax=Edaphochlamys debaryana TaxID=47281 RepID=A0A835XIT2_9CHLO|nr:hypothetical protein HYH03_017243 [Edaphochlamys debaryana]|eukprot:KAG2483922.1 hypothetical protein HYH03_017243 [Edaphochlamys debaryana]